MPRTELHPLGLSGTRHISTALCPSGSVGLGAWSHRGSPQDSAGEGTVVVAGAGRIRGPGRQQGTEPPHTVPELVKHLCGAGSHKRLVPVESGSDLHVAGGGDQN